jgi:hypothetical protein
MSAYSEFLARKAQLANAGGFEPSELPDQQDSLIVGDLA